MLGNSYRTEDSFLCILTVPGAAFRVSTLHALCLRCDIKAGLCGWKGPSRDPTAVSVLISVTGD